MQFRAVAAPCRCEEIAEMHGADARRYAAAHLVVDERVDAFMHFSKGVDLDAMRPSRQEWLNSLRGNAYGELVCPNTGWRFRESIRRDADEYSLTRRPRTNRSDYLDAAIVRERAVAVDDTHRLIHVTERKRDQGARELQDWVDAAAQAKVAVDALYSPDFVQLIRAIPSREADALEAAYVYLEVDPWCFRSGYYKQKILVRLARVPRPALDEARLQRALLSMACKGRRAEWGDMCRLAWHLRSDDFAREIESVRDQAETDGQRAALTTMATIVSDGSRRSGVKRRRRRSKRS